MAVAWHLNWEVVGEQLITYAHQILKTMVLKACKMFMNFGVKCLKEPCDKVVLCFVCTAALLFDHTENHDKLFLTETITMEFCLPRPS